ncbi:MAG: choice-of-anchor D domain-containing protein [Bacteroidota bacterium]|nr:choice-of-anchor D domain-containing protein [Bacteroidota bacterium]MDW8271195.1 choice-of-anchor D domain-containing protein [Bacteroidota bacterium]
MATLKQSLVWIGVALLILNNARSQTFTIVDVDVSNFPRVRSQLIANDPAGNPYPNLRPSDFSVTENGRSMQPTLQVNCETSTEEPTANVVLVVDRSASMLEIVDRTTNETRWDWVKAGVQEFLRQFPFNPPSSVALISFGGVAELSCPFKTSAQPIIDSLNKIRPDGSTKYDPPLLNPSFGAIYLLSQMPRNIRRIIIFLTDGQPDVPPQTDTIIARCRREAITFYAITVGLNMNSDLDRIARATGGKSYAVFTKERLKDIYRLIALETTQRLKCYLEWIAPWSCSEQERIRTVQATFLRTSPPITSTLQYTAPPQSIARLDVSPSVAYFGNPNPGSSTTVKLSIKPLNAPMQVTALPIVPAGYYTIVDMGGKTLPFTLQPGEIWEPTVQFTQQGSKQFRQATLTIEGNPCPVSITLIGGLSRALVIAPNGGELFSTCDSVTIRWAGVEPNQGVDLYYALDGDQPNPTWRRIAQNVVGYSYRWKPPQAGQNYRVRVVVPPDSGYQWAQQIGGASFDTCRSIVLDSRQMYVHVAGTFTNSVTVNGTTINSLGESDMFVARFDTDGNLIWIRNGGGPRTDQGCCLAIDNNDNLYVAGVFRSPTAQFGSATVNKSSTLDVTNAFVAVYTPNGNAIQVAVGGGSSTGQCEVYVDSIAFAGGSIYLYGRFRGRLQFSTTPGTFINSANANTFDPFTAVLSPSLAVTNLQRRYLPAPYTRATVWDTSGNRYEAGGFSAQLRSGSITLTSRGGTDAYVRKFGFIPGSEDISDGTFRVQSPLVRFRSPVLTVGSIAVGEVRGEVFSGVLCNDGEIPVIISAMRFSGANPANFQLVSNWQDYVLKPGECISVEILFRPGFEGAHTAILTVEGNCGAPAQVTVNGTGLPPCKYTITAPELITTSVGIERRLTNHCLVRNTGNEPLSGTLKLTNNPSNAFTVVVRSTGCTVDAATGCPFDIPPGQCVAVDISFLPSSVGQHSATLLVELPAKCGGTQQQFIVGNALPSEVELEVPQFGSHRVLTTTTLPARIRNANDSLDAVITAIQLRSPNANFQLRNLPTTPFTLPARQERTFEVEFTPQLEGDLSEWIEVSVQGLNGPIAAQTRGRGTLPKIEAADVTFAPWPVSAISPEIGSLVIRNTSSTAPLVVKSISSPTSASFWFDTPPPTNVTIPVGESLVLPVRFRPSQVGNNVAQVNIISDAAPGPNPNPDVTTTVTLQGLGLALTISQPEDFGDILLCHSVITRVVTITNPSTVAESFSIAVQGDIADFAVTVSDTIVPPGGTATISIQYTPTPGTRTIEIVINSSALAQPQRLRFSATGVTRPLTVTVGNAIIDVGKTKPVSLLISTTPDAGILVTRLQFKLDYPTGSVDIDDQSFQVLQNNWRWTMRRLPTGALLEGIGAVGIPNGTLEVQIPFTTFLASTLAHTVDVSFINASDYPCLVVQTTRGTITTPNYCAQQIRQIILNTPTTVSVSHDHGDVTVNIAIGEDMPFRAELYSTLGSRALQIAEGQQRGNYHYTIPAGRIPSGAYYLRLWTPIHTEVIPVLITP